MEYYAVIEEQIAPPGPKAKEQSMTPTPRRLVAAALLLALAAGLGGCLVKKEKPAQQTPPYYRTSETLRTYQAGDYLEYNVQALLPKATAYTQGRMRISWDGPFTITGPINQSFPAMKKTYQLCWYDQNGNPCYLPGDALTTLVHYVLQDGTGTERFVAMDAADNDTYYWVNTLGSLQEDPTDGGTAEPAEILRSPLQSTAYTTAFYIMNCAAGGTEQCASSVAKETRYLTVTDDNTLIPTNVERFANPYRITYSNGNVTLLGTETELPMGPLDLFSICSRQTSTHRGTMYVVPEIGMIYQENTCDDIGDGKQPSQYIFSITNVSFHY